MNWLNQIFRRGNLYNDLAEEMREHLEEKTEQLQREGLPRKEAEKAARRVFGNPTLLEERGREVWQWPALESHWADLRFALRQLRKSPAFAVTAILVLALGIAASVSIFAFVNAALLKPLPYRNPSRLASVFGTDVSGCTGCGISYPDYLDLKRGNAAFSSFEAWEARAYLWKRPAGVESLRAARVSGGFFRTLGITPILGRAFTPADDTPSAPLTVLLPYATWQSRFGGRADIIGQPITLDNASYTVIGILPRGFYFPQRAAELWITFHNPDGWCDENRSCHDYFGLARLKDGLSLQTASANLSAIAAHLQKQYPDSNGGQGVSVISLSDASIGDVRPILLVLLSGAALLLLISCVNVASLLLVRAENRRREMAVRGALGASAGRLVRQLVTEAFVLVSLSVALGLASAWGAIRLLFSLIPERVLRGMPYFRELGYDHRTLLFAAAVCLVALAVCSIAPALRLSFSDLRAGLADGSRASSGAWKRFGSNLVVVELALAVVLLASAGLLGKSFYRILHVDLNFNPDHLATLEIDANTGYDTPVQQLTLSRNIIARVTAIPGVFSVAGNSGYLPVSCNCDVSAYRVLGQPLAPASQEEEQTALHRTVTSDYFRTLQARLLTGRFFTEADNASSPPVVIINRAFARQFFPNQDPIGRIIDNENLSPGSLRKIIGIVDDIREGALDDQIRPAVYTPFNQNPGVYGFLIVRTTQNPAAMLPGLVAAIHSVAPGAGVRNEFTMAEHIADSQIAYFHSSATWIVGGFAASALLLGIIGLYGVIAFSVSQRTREIGVRMALGAQRGAVCRLILGEAGWLVLLGLTVGLIGSIQAGLLLRSILFGVSSWDLPTLAAVAIVLALAALFAAFIPARRAASVNPVEALRAE